ncbi:sulfate/molybdate ABC transporter ATP-binding protein [Mitsuokella sp. oral taxon 131]|uniref:sulfate/molybdate ABC transporter ATP-binding protein n=1 Tax=Mitsuokella sp. oral taxon 131 TaxID=1321780 RepID=UPI0003ADC95F|nr:ATP-binding cassette domain-containing protein [Mitsuokella sp. oral taxon 131]ERL04672.1 Fe(3+)-transporting ATPase family protein [Mitsuokella sp. oral taxon 131 str. W9106]
MKLEVRIRKRLRNFTLDASFETQDEVFALLGASGCGKSMTLKCIAGLAQPDAGRIVLNGRVLYDSARGIDLSPQKRRIGYLFQNFALFPNMTIADNIRFVARGTKEEKERIVHENLVRFSLLEQEHAYPAELSGGQQQRAALARILATDAELLLLDEPFSALDSYLKWQLELELMEVLADYGGAALFVSHDRGEVYRLASRIAIINRGQMESVHTRRELFHNPTTLTATLLTGCKNVSHAERIDASHVRAKDWQIDLCVGEVQEKIHYVGLRAHFLEYRTGAEHPAENIFCMDVVRIIEDTFSYLIMVRRAGTDGALIRWELPKETWHAIAADAICLYFPPGEIMQLER